MLGAVQGIILGSLLLREGKASNRILAVLLFFFTYRLLAQAAFISFGWGSVEHWSYQVLFEYDWVYGALLYFYIASYLNPNFKWQRKHWWHFLPVLIEFLFSNWVKYQNFYWDGSLDSLPSGGVASYMLWKQTPFKFLVASSLILYYVYLSKQLVKQLLKDETLLLNQESLKWIQQILMVYQLFSILVLFVVLVDYLFFEYAFNPFYVLPIYGAMAIITYWLGLQGFAHRTDIPFKKINTPNISHLQTIADQLKALMEEQRPYLNPDLNLKTLAVQLNIKPYLLTQTLNQVIQKKFNDYISEYRVAEVQKLFNNKKYDHYTLLAIGQEAGFNSKATFNRMVKKHTGKSPTELRKMAQLDK